MPNPHLPAETLDHIVGYLHDTEDALRSCCLVSKSWLPRTRKHLFVNIELPTEESLELWQETFPDPSTSPARYTKILFVGCLYVVTAADADAHGWIRVFSSVEHLEVGTRIQDFSGSATPLAPFYGFSPTVKSLRIVFPFLPSPQVFDLILSFPLLEDLTVIVTYNVPIDSGDGSDWLPTTAQPSIPPMFTGSLELQGGGMKHLTRRLLSLPDGIHFRELTLRWLREEDLSLTTALVQNCSRTLESLNTTWNFLSRSIEHLLSNRRLTTIPRWVDRPLKSDET